MKKKFTAPLIEIKQLGINAILITASIPMGGETDDSEPNEVKSLHGGLKNNISWD